MINEQNTDKSLIEAASKVLGTSINEGVNDHEKTHKKILGDLHKEYPEMNINNSKHVSKNTYPHRPGEEFHTYESDIPVHDSVKHLFKNLKAKTTISHSKDGHHATLDYAYEHHSGGTNGVTVANHFKNKDSGKHYVRHYASGVTKES